MLDNLLENARRHAAGSTPVIVVGREDGWAQVLVSTRGAPIDPALARRLFEPFERGSASSDGAGLGLYVCRTLVVAHGGDVGVRADEDGNHFWVRLPLVAHDTI